MRRSSSRPTKRARAGDAAYERLHAEGATTAVEVLVGDLQRLLRTAAVSAA